jgi:hypothetical protein
MTEVIRFFVCLTTSTAATRLLGEDVMRKWILFSLAVALIMLSPSVVLAESEDGEHYPVEVEALILGEFEVLNDARFLNVSVHKEDKCFVHKKSELQVLHDLEDDKVIVLYKPALVFLHGEGTSVNLWDDYKRGGVDLCPFGAEMILEKAMMQQWQTDRDMLVVN